MRFPTALGGASGRLDIAKLSAPDMLLPDEFEVEQRLWASPPHGGARGACAEQWVEIHSIPRVIQIADSGSGPSLLVGGGALALATPGVTFLLQGRVKAVGLSATPAKTAWARAWNLEAREAEIYVASHPKVFRTLNLREIVTMLEGLVRDRIEPRAVGEALARFSGCEKVRQWVSPIIIVALPVGTVLLILAWLGPSFLDPAVVGDRMLQASYKLPELVASYVPDLIESLRVAFAGSVAAALFGFLIWVVAILVARPTGPGQPYSVAGGRVCG